MYMLHRGPGLCELVWCGAVIDVTDCVNSSQIETMYDETIYCISWMPTVSYMDISLEHVKQQQKMRSEISNLTYLKI